MATGSEDPGNREVPLKRQSGDPFEKGLTNDNIAARLEGRKIETSKLFAGKFFDTMYRVDRFRRLLPNRGSDGRGLIQFWGPRARREYKAGDDQPEWEVVDQRKMHTVNVGEITKLR